MSAPVVLPDGKQIAIELLAADLPDVHVTGQLPEGAALNAALPAVRVLRIGGVADVRGWADPASRDNPRFSIDCYATSDDKAMHLARRVCAAWELLPGRMTADGIVTGISQETGPQDRPEDPNADLWRVGMTLGMSVSPPRPIS
ncbi:hypothetical protein JL475_00530 [Streptomyces sp. M2CJ-2]|uniref:hypothetical protein n=1 Tax=Streptomyces sp. M2CJ-2 TaxID=2803948 RepID=UPI0019251248|nr:hypothetical protein [Streptomyces sp. M2CJ-2]MBL3664532.1 hypothetical protein [Streptomyces sp. M2CJ-2]